MPRLSESLAGDRNALAFLDMLAWSEGTSTSPATAMYGYDVIVTGADRKPEVFKDFTDHPFAKGRASKVINSKPGQADHLELFAREILKKTS